MFKGMRNTKTLLVLGLLVAASFVGGLAVKAKRSTNFSVISGQGGANFSEAKKNSLATNTFSGGVGENKDKASIETSFSTEFFTASYYRRELSQLLILPIDEFKLSEAASLVENWALKNGLKAANFLSNLKLGIHHKSTLLLVLYKAWGQYDAQGALTFYESHLEALSPDAQWRVVPSILMASCDTSKDLKACITSIAHTAEIDRALAYIADEKNTIEESPAEAIAWAQLIQSESVRLDLIDEIAGLWAEFDPEAAITWALENNEIKSVGTRAMVQLSRFDPWSAQQVLKGIPEGEQELRRLLLSSLISAQVEQDNFETVIALLDEMPIEGGRARYYESFVEEWSLKNPNAAASSIMALPSGRRRDALLATVAKYWGEQYPSEALNFISTITDGAARKNAMSQALVSWSFKDVDSASHWLQRQPDSQQKDKTIARVTEQLIGSQVSQQSVLGLVEMINDIDLKAMLLERASRVSAFEDEEAE